MPSKIGAAKNRNKALEVLHNGFLQLRGMRVFIPMYEEDLTPKQAKEALRAASVMKEKKDRTLKGRTASDGSRKRGWHDKKDIASPAAHADSVMLTSAIEAHEGRLVGTGDAKGAHLRAIQDDFATGSFRNEQVEAMCEITEGFKECVVQE